MQQNQKKTPLVTIAEAAALFAVTRRTIHNWIQSGILPATKIGGVVRIRRAELEKLMGGLQ